MKQQKKSLKFLQLIVLVLFLASIFSLNSTHRKIYAWIALAGIVGTLLLFLVSLLPDKFQIPVPKRKQRKENTPDMETLLLRQINYQITEKLKSAYPDASWDFVKDPIVSKLISGQETRIRTHHTGDFNFAEFHMTPYGNLSLQMLTIESLKREANAKDDSDRKIDPESWYSLIGKPVLTELVSDLQARGYQKLSITENGEIYIQNGEMQELKDTFAEFPPKTYWPALSDIFIRDELSVNETDDTLEISWAA